MAVLQKILEFFAAQESIEPEIVSPAPKTTYDIRPLTDKHLKEVLALNLRCFSEGENYTRHTFDYLLHEPNCLSYRIVAANETIAGFIFVMVGEDGAGHITTIGVAPEHRRRNLANCLLERAESALKTRGVNTVRLEVRAGNLAAQTLYERRGYAILQKLPHYYNNGEDAFLMVKAI